MFTNTIPEKWRGRLAWGLDLLLAAVLTGTALYDIWAAEVPIHLNENGISGPRLPNTIIFILVGLALLIRRRMPVATLLVVVPTLVVQSEFFSHPSDMQRPLQSFLALLLVFYSTGAYAEPRRAAIGGAFAGAAVVATDLPYLIAGHPRQDTVPSWIFMGTVWFAGWAFYKRRSQAARLESRAARLERERDEQARIAVAEAHARIARELHDVVAHSVSVMVVQAQAAQRLIDREPHDARRALDSIEASGRQALVELRRMLGILRRTGEEPALNPQPGLRHLAGLAEQFRTTGLPVELNVEGEPKTLPPGVDLSAYRIVQEALTNVLNHAGPARARVTVRYRDDEAELEIVDDGAGTGKGGGSGHGLIGMRERAALYGGVLESGKREAGGYFVRARLPLGTPFRGSPVEARTT